MLDPSPRSRRSPCRLESLEGRVLLAAYVAPANPRADLNLDAGWRFNKGDVSGASTTAFNDAAWSNVNLPHTWNASDGQDGGNNYYRGVGWYRKHFTLSSTYSGRQFYMKFEGAMLRTDFYINGTFVGTHKGGYAAFAFDVTPYLKVGADNVFAVKVNNANDDTVAPITYKYAPDWTLFGGLYRDVHLIVAKTLNVTPLDFGSPGVFLKQTSVSSTSANLQITTELKNNGGLTRGSTVTSYIVDAANNVVQTLTNTITLTGRTGGNVVQNTTVTSPHLWNGVKDPYLYKVYTQVFETLPGSTTKTLTDVIANPLGFRSFRADPKQGFLLNGQKYDLHGLGYNDDRLNLGMATTAAQRAEDLSLLKEVGSTGVRLAHYQRSPDVYDQLDKLGLAAISEIPLDANLSANSANQPALTDNLVQQLKELIRQNYNHPAVLYWGLYNELAATSASYALVDKLNQVAHAEDPTRATTGSSNLTTDSQTIPFKTDVNSFNKYFGWYIGTLNDVGPWMDRVHASYPSLPIGLMEYGAGGSAFQHQDNPTQPSNTGTNFHPEEYLNTFHEAYLTAMSTRPWLWANFPWQMFDSASDFRNQGDTPGRNDKGLITYDRKTKKDVFYLYKANWSSDAVLYLTSRRFTNRTTATTTVKVYSNLSSVTLTVNGVTVGSPQTPNTIKVAKWSNVALQPGANTITVNGTINGKVLTDTATWTYTPAATAARVATVPFATTAVKRDSLATGLI